MPDTIIINPSHLAACEAIRYGRHLPPGADIGGLVRDGFVLVRANRLALTPEGYRATAAIPPVPPSLDRFDADDSGARDHVLDDASPVLTMPGLALQAIVAARTPVLALVLFVPGMVALCAVVGAQVVSQVLA